MAFFRLIPREETFYVDFVAMADQVRAGARLLEEMLAVDPPHADKAHEINVAAARIAREVADGYATPDRPRWVAGSIQPGWTCLPRPSAG